MRLGSYACRLAPDSLAFRLYGEEIIHERHRHRYEFNCLYEKTLDRARPADRRPVARRQVRRDRRTARTSRGTWPCSSIRSSSRSRCARIRSSPASSRPPTSARWRVQGVATNVTAIGDRRGERCAWLTARGLGLRARRPCRSPKCRSPTTSCSAASRSCSSPGPCVIESEAHALELGRGDRRRSPGAPACPTSSKRRSTRRTARRPRRSAARASTRGSRSWRESARELGVPVLTDIHEAWQAERGGEGRRRAADSRVPVAPDGPARGRRADRPRRQHQEGPVSRAARHEARAREGARVGQRRACS